jgi:hypothetical protein
MPVEHDKQVTHIAGGRIAEASPLPIDEMEKEGDGNRSHQKIGQA